MGVHDANDVKAAKKSVLNAVEVTIACRPFRDLPRAAATNAES
jgi:hypothetical protein